MTDLQKKQVAYLDLNHAYQILNDEGVSLGLLLEMNAVVEKAYKAYRDEYQLTLFSALVGV